MRYVNATDGKQLVFDRPEADILGIEYQTWQDWDEEAEYILSTDGEVVPVLYVFYDHKNGRYVATTPFGQIVQHYPFETRKSTRRASLLNSITSKRRELLVRMVIIKWARSGSLEQAYYEVYGRHLKRPDRFIYNPEVMQVAREVLSEILAELGIDKNFVLLNYLKLLEESKNDLVKLKVNDRLADLVGLFKKEKMLPPASEASNVIKGRLKSAQIYSGEDRIEEADFEVVGDSSPEKRERDQNSQDDS